MTAVYQGTDYNNKMPNPLPPRNF